MFERGNHLPFVEATEGDLDTFSATLHTQDGGGKILLFQDGGGSGSLNQVLLQIH